MSRPHPFDPPPRGPEPVDPPPPGADAADPGATQTYDVLDEARGESTGPPPLSVSHLADGRYELGGTLGSGGMGLVRRARDLRLSRDVAIKLLADNLAADPVARARFLREARSAAAITDPCVVAVHDVGDEAGRPYLVMELVDGPSLADVLRTQGPLPVSRLLGVVTDALTGLAATHAAGIVHRDVKPGNLLLAPSGQVKLTDLGVAEATDESGLTRTGMVVGTRTYLAPERRTGGAATERTDLYALGVTFVELLFGAGVDEPLERVEQAPGLPGRLRTLLLQLLAVDPRERPASAQVARSLLEARVDDPTIAAGAVHDAARTEVLAPDGEEPAQVAASVAPGAAGSQVDQAREDAPAATRWRPYLLTVAVVVVFVIGLFWGEPPGDGVAEDTPPAEEPTLQTSDGSAPADGAVPRDEDPSTTARNLAEWLRQR